jgi:hypothetical protein
VPLCYISGRDPSLDSLSSNSFHLKVSSLAFSFGSVEWFEIFKGFLGISFHFVLWRFTPLVIYRVYFITS